MHCTGFNKQAKHITLWDTRGKKKKKVELSVTYTLDFLVNLSLSNLIAMAPPMSEKNRLRSSSFACRERGELV